MGRAKRKRTARRKRTSKTHTLLDLPAAYFKAKRKPATPAEQQALAETMREFCERAFGPGEPETVTVPLLAEQTDNKPAELPPRQEAIRRIRKEYPGGLGDRTVAAVRRKISDKMFNPSWDTVKRALLEIGWQPKE
jgi:hypothetical protein